MDGVGLARFVRRHRPETKVILTTGGTLPKERDDELGTTVPVLKKPYRLGDLLLDMQRLLGMRARLG